MAIVNCEAAQESWTDEDGEYLTLDGQGLCSNLGVLQDYPRFWVFKHCPAAQTLQGGEEGKEENEERQRMERQAADQEQAQPDQENQEEGEEEEEDGKFNDAAAKAAEEIDGTPAHDCRVTMHEEDNFGGWSVEVAMGRHPVGELEKLPLWQNDQVGSITVDEGCVAIAYEHGDFAGWHAILAPGKHPGKAIVKAGGKENDLSSLVVVAGTEEDALAAHSAIEEDHANMIKREAHELTAENFDEFVQGAWHDRRSWCGAFRPALARLLF